MKLKNIAILVIFGITAQCKFVQIQWKRTSFQKYEGKWELFQIEKSGKSISADKLNNCAYKEVVNIKMRNELTNLNFDEDTLAGFQIGKTKEKICEVDPETFEYKIYPNSCYNQLVALKEVPLEWYEIGEGKLVKYRASIQSGKLTLHLEKIIKDYGSGSYDKLIFKRLNENN